MASLVASSKQMATQIDRPVMGSGQLASLYLPKKPLMSSVASGLCRGMHLPKLDSKPASNGVTLPTSSFYGKSVAARSPFTAPSLRSRAPLTPVCMASSSDAGGSEVSPSKVKAESEGFLSKNPALVTGFFFFMWYFLNVIFNILNKKIYNYFPYPYFVSVIHLLVGVVYCCVCWTFGLPKRAV